MYLLMLAKNNANYSKTIVRYFRGKVFRPQPLNLLPHY